jgi:hypothetical protein
MEMYIMGVVCNAVKKEVYFLHSMLWLKRSSK